MRTLAAALLATLIASPVQADVDEDDKKWILEVKPLMLEDEEKTQVKADESASAK